MKTYTLPTSRRALVLGATVAAMLVLLATTSRGAATTNTDASLHTFLERLESGIEIDFAPLTSAANAVAVGDTAVLGSLEDVSSGVTLDFGDEQLNRRATNRYVSLVIVVDEVLAGRTALVRGQRVHVQLAAGADVDLEALRADNPHPTVVAVLDELSDWDPGTARVVRPQGVAQDAPLFAPYMDGLWFQGADGQLVGIHASPEELGDGWGGVRTVKEYAARLRAAEPERILPTPEPTPDGSQGPTDEPYGGDPRPVPPEADD